MLALSGAYQSQVNAMDAASADLLARIGKVDAAIAAASRPPGAGALSYSQQQVAGIIVAAAARYGVDSNMLIHVAMCESGLNPNAYDAASGASGLFQFMPGTFYGNGGHNIWDPNDQATVAARMFSQGLGGAWTCR
jgi:soluble lytic murein transglycosylase-like protein